MGAIFVFQNPGSSWWLIFIFLINLYYMFLLILGGERKKEREREPLIWKRNIMASQVCTSTGDQTCNTACALTRYGVSDFSVQGWLSANWATLARAGWLIFRLTRLEFSQLLYYLCCYHTSVSSVVYEMRLLWWIRAVSGGKPSLFKQLEGSKTENCVAVNFKWL